MAGIIPARSRTLNASAPRLNAKRESESESELPRRKTRFAVNSLESYTRAIAPVLLSILVILLFPDPSLPSSSFSFPRDWFCARANGLSISKGDPQTREPEEPADRPTLVSLRERSVTCRRVKAIPCHEQIGMPKVTVAIERGWLVLQFMRDLSRISCRSRIREPHSFSELIVYPRRE